LTDDEALVVDKQGFKYLCKLCVGRSCE